MTETTESVYLVNNFLKQDDVLKDIFGNKFNIFPLYADEPTPGKKSYPYIRYQSVPIIDGINWRIRRDMIQYIVGDKSYKSVGRAIERIIDLLHIDDDVHSTSLPIIDDRYRIFSSTLASSTPPRPPDQEGGVYERGLNFIITFVKRTETS